ncbi:PREDICTED: uncharacterized protein LOC101315165 [Fragaria vesca subsp. vesca]|uniref:uncharacterized protein LOC101315165 n=1 Tax=Fragaria vesca subsp. vesca TaxID=101020 RepID=UPI0002C2E59B|nr:PREDICTED: uncharacterized protein LOC101315165 [Fragaria vesca subsp. vesca]
MKDQLWAIAKSYYLKEMVMIKEMQSDAYDWLTDPDEPTRNPKHWCRAHFNTILKCDVLLNNLCETFNAFILPTMSKPVISCFEDIKVKLMKKVAARKEKMSKVIDPICPKPREILEKNKVKSTTDCIPSGTGSPMIEVDSIGGGRYMVDLQRRKCACRRWDLTGIPCKHAVSAINFMRQKPEGYVDACYLTKTYMDIYPHTVTPVNGMDMWMPTNEQAILPPQYNRQPGRPKTKRNKEASERNTEGGLKLGRVQKSLRCRNCGTLGHNIKTCHKHLPPKTSAAHGTGTKKRRLNSGEAPSTKEKGTKPPPKTKNELRTKAQLRKAAAKDKRDEKRAAEKAAAMAAGKGLPTRSRPPKATTSTV